MMHKNHLIFFVVRQVIVGDLRRRVVLSVTMPKKQASTLPL